MASSANLGFPCYVDGMEWTSLLSRTLIGGVAVWDTNASATAVNPLGGVFHGPGSPLKVTQQASPAMSVLVNAGYVAVPHPTAQHGVYLFGLQDQGTITIASNPAGSARYDLIVARVYDTDNSSSYCDVEVVEGTAGDGQPATPSAAFLLAVVEVPASATSIGTADITDKRTFTVAPGCVLPATTANAPPLAPGQVVLDTSTGLLERLSAPVTYTQTWTIPGTYSWTVPDNTTTYTPSATASGGGGGPGSGVGSPGGGAAEWAGEPPQAATPGDTATIVVPAGGAAAATSSDSAGAGDVASFTLGDLVVQANPGQPGTTTPGDGGTGSANTYHNDGGPGGAGCTSLNAGGGGGASGGPGAPGDAGGPGNTGGAGGYGGLAVPGGGPGGFGGDHAGPGYAPVTGPGGGGGGPGGETAPDGSPNPSGAGADGQVTVTWTVQPSALTPVFATDSAEDDLSVVDTSTGAAGSSGLTAASGSGYGWGIGYGSTTYSGGGFWGFGGSGSDADGQVVPQIQVEFDADGATDFQFGLKWGLAVPEAAVDSASPSIASGQCRIILQLDGKTLDTVYLTCAASGGVTKPGDGGAWTYYTSAQNGTTPSSGTHTATLAVETMNTLSGQLSGAHIGNLASVGTSAHPFGGSALASGFTSALVAENCSLRVAGIAAAAV